ncbi:hypothetical protein DXG01_014501 [Tephrocybe rancida]|nr:hypothetical protein DXG01_014501 [Tephrocybe rancida]
MVSTRRQSTSAITGATASPRTVGTDSGSKVVDMQNSESDPGASGDEEAESDWEKRGEKGKGKAKAQPAAKRKKVSGNAKSSTTKTTKITGRKKDISLLLTMPLDVIFAVGTSTYCAMPAHRNNSKVFLELEPKDLVTLARTSKSLRETLVARNALSIWKTVREERESQDGRRYSSVDLDASYVVESKFASTFSGQDKALLDLIPYTNTGGWSNGHASKSRFFWKADIEDMMRQWNALRSKGSADTKQKLEEFRKERKEFVAGVLEVIIWAPSGSGPSDYRLFEGCTELFGLVEAIRQKLLDLGYEGYDIQFIMRHQSVDSPNELTDLGWARIREGLEEALIKIRDRRIEQERQRRIGRRLDTFEKPHPDPPPANVAPIPHWREVAAFPVFDEILGAPDDVTVNESSLDLAMTQLPGLVATWLEDKKAKLTQLASAHHASNPHPTTVDVLTLATSVFRCANSLCGNDRHAWASILTNPLFGWSDAAHHVCENARRDWYFGEHPQSVALNKTAVDFFQEASGVAAQLVQLVGLDPDHATAADMDQGGHYFFCSGCSGTRRTVYTWRTAVAHFAQHYHVVTPSLQLLTSAEVQDVMHPGDPANEARCEEKGKAKAKGQPAAKRWKVAGNTNLSKTRMTKEGYVPLLTMPLDLGIFASAAATGVVGSSRAVISGPESGSKLLAMGTSDSDGSDVSDDEEPESDWERRGEKGKSKSKVQSAAKRRKVAGNANSSTTKTTKITRRKKDISLLLTMPLDVIFAVFLELELRDLVMLTRTSKLLRETLVARNALSVWKSIREEREVPEPPQDFSEPRWASLLFGGSWCQCCGAPNIQTIDFYLRRRLCTKCKKQNYVVESKFTGLFPGQDKALLDLIPHTNTGGWAHGHASKSRFYWKADIEDLISQWTVLKLKNTADAEKKLEEFRKEKKEFVAGVLEDAVSYLTWSRRSSLERDDDSRERRKHRAAAIRQKFLDMGYSANDILYIMNRRSVDSPNELTDRGWARIRGGLEKTLIDERDRRIEQERQRRISRRLDTFKKILDTHTLTLLPPMWLQYPHWREVAAFPVFDDVLSASDDVIVDEESFQPAIAQLPGLVATWLEDRKAKLSQLASAHALTPHPTTTDAVNLATSVFKCGNSSCVNDKPAWTSISTNPLFGWTDAARHCSSWGLIPVAQRLKIWTEATTTSFAQVVKDLGGQSIHGVLPYVNFDLSAIPCD